MIDLEIQIEKEIRIIKRQIKELIKKLEARVSLLKIINREGSILNTIMKRKSGK